MLMTLVSTVAIGQERPEPGTISGSVLDSAGLQPLQYARVTLEPLPSGVVSLASSPGTGLIQMSRMVRTDVQGRYRFHAVAPGRYRLSVRRIGFRPTSIDVSLGNAGQISVSVGLTVVPIVLTPVAAVGLENLFGRANPAMDPINAGRAMAVAERRAQHVNTDVRTLTHHDVLESITLGEADVFRALQRIPGVNTRDDWTAELWIRGAGWDQTQVYFDGLPMFNPLHGGGVTSAVHADAIGTLFLYPGVRPTSIGGGASGVIDIRSRPARNDGNLHGFGALSVLNASLSLEHSVPTVGFSGVVTMRRSAWNNIPNNGQDATRGLPAAADDGIFDLALRVDQRIGSQTLLSVSGLIEEDRITPQDDFFVANDARWGNSLGRATLSTQAGEAQFSTTVGLSHFTSDIRQTEETSIVQTLSPTPTQLPTNNSMYAAQWTGEAHTPIRGTFTDLSIGYQLLDLESRYDGAALTPFTIQTFLDSLSVNGSAMVASFWGTTRASIGPFDLDAGTRIETGSRVNGSGHVRFAPRLSGSYSATETLEFSISAGRSFQYFRAIGPAGIKIGPGLVVGHVWAVAGDTVPAVETEIATVASELLLGTDWIGSLAAYVRNVEGLLIPDPTPGEIPLQSLGINGSNRAWGFEVSLRKVAGRVTGSLGYSFGHSRMEAAGLEYPAAGDYRHSFDIIFSTILDDQIADGTVRVGAAYSANSGSPFTRLTPTEPRCSFETNLCRSEGLYVQSEPNAGRGNWYGSLDLLAEWYRTFGGFVASAFFQLRNGLDQTNAATFRTEPLNCARVAPQVQTELCDQHDDEFEPGIPVYPAFGFRISF